MKLENGYWTDKNENKWNAKFFSKEESEECSKSLVNCYFCLNCKNCKDCKNCSWCQKCNWCDNCNSCDHCNSCIHCIKCDFCEHANGLIENEEK